MESVLRVESLRKRFGGLQAVADLSFALQRGECLGLVGPNGAGKSTVINLIAGFLRPDDGRILVEQQDVAGLPAHRVAALGVVRTFQADVTFSQLTVRQHLLLACEQERRVGLVGLFFGYRGARAKAAEARQRAEMLLDGFRLSAVANAIPQHLSHGHQRWLGILMALALRPRILLLDEPLSGMNEHEIELTLELLRQQRQVMDISIVLVEHNMRAVMRFCDRLVVLDQGTLIAEGPPHEIERNPSVIEAYLGSAYESSTPT
jgi:branched-chain amino acid transport system ATP-binding protein